jgi:membrane-associated protein
MTASWSGLLPYLGILVAAAVEGEVAYVTACTLVAAGRLHPAGVVIAGAIGAAAGDQAYFYVFRGRLARWMARFPSLERKTAALVGVVRRRPILPVLFIRFSPGLRIALTAACAYVDVAPALFSLLNALTAVIWALALLALVAWGGPAALAGLGLSGWKAALLMGVLLVIVFRVLGRLERRSIAKRE